MLGKALSGNASAQTGAAQRYFPIISGLDIATFPPSPRVAAGKRLIAGWGREQDAVAGNWKTGKP